MPQSESLTDVQLEAAKQIAAGLSQSVAARVVGVDRATVCRWLRNPAFQAEVDRRRAAATAAVGGVSLSLPMPSTGDSENYISNIAVYRAACLQVRQLQIDAGKEALQKLQSRIQDLPAESFTPNMIAGMMSAANSSIEEGLKGWAELLAIDSVIEKLQGGGGS